jgi:hypothetical protein
VPSLIGQDLPPCGLSVQVAYENVNARLRKRWLYFRGQKPLSEVCQVVKDDLANQSILFPSSPRASRSIGKSPHRTPWRRESVFYYEIRWIDYFLRETRVPEPMTESELLSRADQPVIPKELGLECNRKDVLALWDIWHKKKRAMSPPLPGMDAEFDLKAGLSGVERDPENEVEELGGVTDIIDKVSVKKTENDIQRDLQAGSSS